MAAGFWKHLLASAFRETEGKELKEEEILALKKEGHMRRHYFISGRVQEVGFRYTAFYIAENLGLSGWVANLDDGRVEMEVQGKEETIDRLLCRLDGNGRIRIEGIEEEEIPLREENGFFVR